MALVLDAQWGRVGGVDDPHHPCPTATAGARPSTWKVAVTVLVARSMRVTRPLSLPTHSDPLRGGQVLGDHPDRDLGQPSFGAGS